MIEDTSTKEALDRLIELEKEGNIEFITLIALIDHKNDGCKILKYENCKKEGVETWRMLALYDAIVKKLQNLKKVIEKITNESIEKLMSEYNKQISSIKDTIN